MDDASDERGRRDGGETRGDGRQSADEEIDALPQFEPPAFVGALALLSAFRSNLLAAFSADHYTQLRVSFRRFGQRFLCLHDPEDVDHVLNTHMSRYQPNVLARRLLEPIAGRGLLLAEGDDWRRQHRQLAPFFQSKDIERLIPSFHETADAVIRSWSGAGAIERNLLLDFRGLTLAVIARSLLSIEDEGRGAQLADFASEAESTGALLEWRDYLALLFRTNISQPPQRRRFAARWRAWVEALLERGPPIEGSERSRNMLDVLRARGDGDGEAPPREEMVDQVGTMLGAGFSTTSLGLFWTALMLALHPAHQEAVRRELCQGDVAAPPDALSLRSSPVAKAFLYESLRLYPPAYIIAREARSDDEIGDFRIPRGTAVIIAPWVMHRHPAHWREPRRFDPERFLRGGRIVTPRAWMPFGVGPRVCIGSAFATTEILVILRRLLAQYRISLQGPVPRPIGRVTLLPDSQPLFALTLL
jgi:cytochrome P450